MADTSTPAPAAASSAPAPVGGLIVATTPPTSATPPSAAPSPEYGDTHEYLVLAPIDYQVDEVEKHAEPGEIVSDLPPQVALHLYFVHIIGDVPPTPESPAPISESTSESASTSTSSSITPPSTEAVT